MLEHLSKSIILASLISAGISAQPMSRALIGLIVGYSTRVKGLLVKNTVAYSGQMLLMMKKVLDCFSVHVNVYNFFSIIDSKVGLSICQSQLF